MEFPELESIMSYHREQEEALANNTEIEWTDYYCATWLQTIHQWINPTLVRRAIFYITTLDQQCREHLPVIHLGALFQEVSIDTFILKAFDNLLRSYFG